MNAMTSSEPKPAYRAAPTATQSPAFAVSDSDCGVLGSAATRCNPLGHHENLTTFEAPRELLSRVAPPTEQSALAYLRATQGGTAHVVALVDPDKNKVVVRDEDQYGHLEVRPEGEVVGDEARRVAEVAPELPRDVAVVAVDRARAVKAVPAAVVAIV